MRPPLAGKGPSFGSNQGPLHGRSGGMGRGPMGNGGGGRLFGRENAMTHANPDRAYGLFGNRPEGQRQHAQGAYDTVFDDTAAQNPFADGFDPSAWEDRMAQMQDWRQQMMARPQMGLGSENAPPVNVNARRWGGY